MIRNSFPVCIVFLLGLDDIASEESDPRIVPEERSELVRDNTRQIYVGLTRAMERLVVYSDHPGMRSALGDRRDSPSRDGTVSSPKVAESCEEGRANRPR